MSSNNLKNSEENEVKNSKKSELEERENLLNGVNVISTAKSDDGKKFPKIHFFLDGESILNSK